MIQFDDLRRFFSWVGEKPPTRLIKAKLVTGAITLLIGVM